MTIKPIDIDNLATLAEGAALFASRDWAQVYANHVQAYGLFDAGSEQAGSFLLFHKQKLGASYTITPPFASHIGLSYQQPSAKKVGQQGQSKEVHRAIAAFLKEKKDIITEITLSTDEIDSQPYVWEDYDVKPRHTYLLSMENTEDELLAAMSAERRKNIRKAISEGLTVRRTEDSDECMALLAKTIERQDISLDKGILKRLLIAPGLTANRAMYICSDREKDLAASLVVWDAYRAYYLIGGYDPNTSHQGAGTLNLWQAIKDAKTRGNTIFDFEGSQLPEVERYFRGFGGELHTFFEISRESTLGKLAKRIKG